MELRDLVWPELTFITRKVRPEMKKSTFFFYCTTGHSDSSFMFTVGDLPFCFQKFPMPGGRPVGEVGGILFI